MSSKGHSRKPSSSKEAIATVATKPTRNAAMLPPPVPAPPLGILEPEIHALSSCLRNSIVKTGQVYIFYADTRRLEINRYAPYPPRSLTSALGREVEKYDQLCDAMEAHLLRAIAVLQRDLSREERRLQEEAAKSAAALTNEPPTSLTSSTLVLPCPSLGPAPAEPCPSTSSESTQPPKLPSVTPARRQSTISLSSLQRPAFPHKLDLSSSALRLNPDEILPSGLSSPVTLAPRSSRASVPPDIDLMAALNDAANRPVDIDLTLDSDDLQSGVGHDGADMNVNSALGNSADKPIELDLDADIFENATNAHMEAHPQADVDFQPPAGQSSGPANDNPKVEEVDRLGMEILSVFGMADHAAPAAQSNNGHDASTVQEPSTFIPTKQEAPSPRSILASFDAPAAPTDPSNPSMHSDGMFDMGDIDLSSMHQSGFEFFDPEHAAGSDVNMEDFFSLEHGSSSDRKLPL